jgi:hypothetical protein
MRTCCASTRGSSTATAAWLPPGAVREADTLVYIDLPLVTHHWWVTKRLIKGLFVARKAGRKTVRCGQHHQLLQGDLGVPSRLTPKYRQLVAEMAASKRVHHIKSPAEMRRCSMPSGAGLQRLECCDAEQD